MRYEPVEQRLLLEKRKNADDPALAVGSRRRVSAFPAIRNTDRERTGRIVVVMNREAQLFHLIGALRAAGRVPRCLHGRKQQAHENPDDRDHDQEFDKRKRRVPPAVAANTCSVPCHDG